MAAVAPGVKIKKKKPRGAPRIKRGAAANGEPTWIDVDKLTGEEYHRKTGYDRAWYYENYKPVDLYNALFEWMRVNDYSPADIKACKAAPNHAMSVTAGITAKLLLSGMPDYNEKHDLYWQSLAGTSGVVKPVSVFIKARIDFAINQGAKIVKINAAEEKATANIHVPTIQERMAETCVIMSSDIEEFVTTFFDTWNVDDLKAFDPVLILRRVQAKAGHARIIKAWFQSEYDEAYELVNIPSAAKIKKMNEHDQDQVEQLKEGYSHLTPKKAKLMLEMYQRIVDGCDIIVSESKALKKPRKIKIRSANDVVKKLKFKPSDTSYGIASVSPERLVGASIAIVFNCKNRKIGFYYAANVDPRGMDRPGSGLSVKGTSIIGHDEVKSVQRTLRKPEEFFPQFKKSTRAKSEKLFDTLKTTETKLNCRFNDETIILAVY